MGIQPQRWMGPAVALVVLILLGPFILRNIRTGQARKRVGRLNLMDASARRAQSDEILDLVEGNADGLVSIADEAIRRGQLPLARLALQRLMSSGKRPLDQHRLAEALDGATPRDVELELVMIGQMIESAAFELARARLARARRAFPSEARLDEVERRIEAGTRNPSA